jgi:hypothetical protein
VGFCVWAIFLMEALFWEFVFLLKYFVNSHAIGQRVKASRKPCNKKITVFFFTDVFVEEAIKDKNKYGKSFRAIFPLETICLMQ